MKMAVVTVATGDYIEGARVLYQSMERHGLPDWVDRLVIGPPTCDFAQPVRATDDYSWLSAPNLKNRESLKNFLPLTLDYDRVLSMNADMLCIGDPSYFWSERIGRLPLYFAHDTAAQIYYPDNLKRLGLDPFTIFNGGLYVYCRSAYPDLYDDLTSDLKAGKLESYEVGDQGYWNHFLMTRNLEIGWLPTGLNYCLDQHFPVPLVADQRVVHFCGPKPWREKRIRDWTLPYYEMWEKERDSEYGCKRKSRPVRIVDTPEVFRPAPCFEYPRYNTTTFEEDFYRYFLAHQPTTKRTYLPILWSVLYYRRHYRQDGMKDLQTFLDRLDRRVQYFTVCAYDGGIFERVNHLDLEVFSSIGDTVSLDPKTYQGRVGDWAIPLVCTPAPDIDLSRPRDILAGFIGARTHPVREAVWRTLRKEPGFLVQESAVSPVCRFETMTQDKWEQSGYGNFKDLMERNVFAICPRGTSPTTFRICESLHYGCVPVYISDKFWFPWSDPRDPSDHGIFDQIGIACLSKDIPGLPDRLRSMPKARIDEYLSAGKKLYADYFSPEGCATCIIEKVNQDG